MSVVQQIFGFFKSLNSNSNPGEIAHAAAIGVLLGMVPKNNMLWYGLFIFFLFVRINKGVYFLVILGMSLIVSRFDVFFDSLGYYILTLDAAKPYYTKLLDIPFVAFTNFNNTIVMGSLVTGLVMYIPVYLVARFIIWLWRRIIAPKITSSKVWIAFKKLPFVEKLLGTYSDISGIIKR